MNNHSAYIYSINVLEPAVVDGFNNKFYKNGSGLHAVQLNAPMRGEKNAYDCILHRDFQVTDFSTGKISFYDVKSVGPNNDRGEYTNFAISKSCENINTLDYFVFVYRNVCYICKYKDVIDNLFPSRDPNNYNFLPLRKIKEIAKDNFIINV